MDQRIDTVTTTIACCLGGLLLLAGGGCEEPGEVYVEANEELPAAGEQVLQTLKKGFEIDVQRALVGEVKLAGLHGANDARAGKVDGAAAINLKFGRTSVRVRNQANAAPAWALRTISEADDVKTHRLEKSVHLLDIGDGRRGYLEAIGTQIHCIRCHVRDSALGEKVRDEIKAQYPEDEAIDFKTGELRGWFWLEYDAAK